MIDSPNPTHTTASRREFTGRHMAIIMVVFFGIIIAVNLVMARYAVSTFGGTVVDNSYVASQKFNGWLAEAEAQGRNGWKQVITLNDERHLILTTTQNGSIPNDIQLRARANHPLGVTKAIRFNMVPVADGQWRSLEALPSGRWLIHTTVLEGSEQAQFRGEVR